MIVRLILCSMFCLYGSPALRAAELIDDMPSEAEQEQSRSARDAGKMAIKLANALLDQLVIQQLRDGNCEPALEVEQKARNGSARAQLLLGALYNEGLCLPNDKATGANWMRRAATTGDADAQFLLGQFYITGEGVTKSSADAIHWFEKAFEGGQTEAGLRLARIYLDGDGVPKDAVVAVSWLEKAVAAGDDDAAARLALHYLRGTAGQPDMAKALATARGPAERGHAASQLVMGVILTLDPNAPGDVLAEAYKWLNLASASKDAIQAAEGAKLRAELEDLMEPAQIMEGQRQSRDFKPVQKATPDEAKRRLQLPKVSPNFADGLEPSEAKAELARLGVPVSKEAFFEAVRTDNLGVFKLFHKAGANLDTPWGLHKVTPVYDAVDFGAEQVFGYLIAQGVNVNTYTARTGSTPLIRAISHERPYMTATLLEKGASARQLPEFEGEATALEYALIGDDEQLVGALLARGATANEVYSIGRTPLMSAACKSDAVFSRLLEGGWQRTGSR